MRRKKYKRIKKVRKIVVSRGGIQLCLIMALCSCYVLSISCTLKHKILPTTIDVNSIEVVTDSIDSSDKFLIFD